MMPKKNPTKKKKKDILLVLDLNGVLFDRRRRTRNSNKTSKPEEEKEELSTILGNFQVYNRPHLDGFIDFLLENFHMRGVVERAKAQSGNARRSRLGKGEEEEVVVRVGTG
jgi:hypothetical protein